MLHVGKYIITYIDLDGEREFSYKTTKKKLQFVQLISENSRHEQPPTFRSRHCRSVVVLTTKSTFGAPLSQPMFGSQGLC